MEDKASLDRARIVDEQFSKRMSRGLSDLPVAKSNTTPFDADLTAEDCLSIFNSQMISRHLDLIARKLREKNQSFYTIGSSGHEGNAAIAFVFELTDMAFLHYRSGAFMIQRAKKDPKISQNIIRDLLFSITASSSDPISGGRHKVFGSRQLYVPPQTSTIASHLPKALGAAFSIPLARDLKINAVLPKDSVVLCSFGDASVNHSTALGAFNAAQWIIRHQLPLPLVFICEDNGIGVSVKTPKNWIEEKFKNQNALEYIVCDGLNFCDVVLNAKKAASVTRIKKMPTFLHFKTVRLLGHAGSDIEVHYHTLQEIEETEAEDPLLHSARILIENKIMSPEQILSEYENVRRQVMTLAEEAASAPKLQTKEEIMSSLIPEKRLQNHAISGEVDISGSGIYPNLTTVTHTESNLDTAITTNKLNTTAKPKTMAQAINQVLNETMAKYSNAVIFGEDVGKKGGVYRITANLQTQFGLRRVFDTLLDEQTILGLSIGLAHNHFLPIPEIQFLAFLHNAEDQLRGEAATLSFFSKGQFSNPMVLRLPGLAYQKGFGGHFHNDNAFAFLREIPGIIVVCPATPHDAVKLFRESIRLAQEEKRIVIFLEPIALYMTKDLYEKNDSKWLSSYPAENEIIAFGEPGIYGSGNDAVIFTYGNGFYLSRQAEKILQEEGYSLTIVDLRWLVPLNQKAIIEITQKYQKILIVDEGRERGSLSEEIITILVENIHPVPEIKRLTAENCFIPLGPAAELLLPSRDAIVKKIREMIRKT